MAGELRGIIVLLTREELELAKQLGTLRHTEAIRMCLPDRDGFGKDPKDNPLEIHIMGVGGEIALAKGLDIKFLATVNTFSAPDLFYPPLGGPIQAKTVEMCRKWVGIRSHDKDEDIFVFVGRYPSKFQFKILGWMSGEEIRRTGRDEYFNRPDRPPLRVVHIDTLHPVPPYRKETK